jgi:hypothetical protein
VDWKSIKTVPFDRDLELAVTDEEGPHALVFPCRRVMKGWVKGGKHRTRRSASCALARDVQ